MPSSCLVKICYGIHKIYNKHMGSCPGSMYGISTSPHRLPHWSPRSPSYKPVWCNTRGSWLSTSPRYRYNWTHSTPHPEPQPPCSPPYSPHLHTHTVPTNPISRYSTAIPSATVKSHIEQQNGGYGSWYWNFKSSNRK